MLVPPRNRTCKNIGEKIDYIQRRRKLAVKEYTEHLDHQNGKQGKKLLTDMRSQYSFYEDLYPVMQMNEDLQLIDTFGQLSASQPEGAATVPAVPLANSSAK